MMKHCIGLLALAALVFSACAPQNPEAEATGVKAAESWLALVDEGAYDQSWQEAAPFFQSAVTESQWVQTMEGTRAPLGKTLSRAVRSATYQTSLPGAPDGEYVVIQFETAFGNKASAIETVTPAKDAQGDWRVSGYFLR